MRHLRLFSTMIVATAFVMFGALAPHQTSAQAKKEAQKKEAPKKEAPGKKEAAPKVGPYKPVAVKVPAATTDASFEAFRKQLADIAQKKDRAALAGLVAASFFWVPADKDTANKAKPGIDNLSAAIGLGGKTATGWDLLADYAAEPTNMPHPQRQGVICAPTQATFDEKEAAELLKATQTKGVDWVFLIRDGVEVRDAAPATAPVIEKLGQHLVRTLEDTSPATAAAAAVKVVAPSGKTGYVSADDIREIFAPQLCFVKEGSGWKIAGFLGRI
jgi:hypothetical protein